MIASAGGWKAGWGFGIGAISDTIALFSSIFFFLLFIVLLEGGRAWTRHVWRWVYDKGVEGERQDRKGGIRIGGDNKMAFLSSDLRL